MNEISPTDLLAQIRTMHAELQGDTRVAPSGPTAFGNLLKDAITTVNETQMQSSAMKRGYEAGTSDASLAEVMIASQKADLSFRAMTEVRNKLVTAYQEIMNMPV